MSQSAQKLSDGQEQWVSARLIPSVGIRGQDEQEKRATSTLLAVIGAVPEFGKDLLSDLSAPKGRISTYTEVQLEDSEGKLSIPDGAIIVERGKKKWSCLVEVKTGSAELDTEQVSRYLDIAREYDFDAVLTISNQIRRSATDVPIDVDKRKLRSVLLVHISWWRIVTEAVIQHRHRGITDPDQAWILGELIAYLDDEKSGASGFHDLGENWVKVRDAARHGTLRTSDSEVEDIAERWQQFIQYLCLGLGQDLGREITSIKKRGQSADDRRDTLVCSLVDEGKLNTSFRVPDAVGPITVEADLQARLVTSSVVVNAPRTGRPKTRVNWMLRQLREAPDELKIVVSFKNTPETTSLLLDEVREHPKRLLSPTDPKRYPRSFRLSLSRPMGRKRGRGPKSFVGETRRQVADFYRDLVQNLECTPPTPKLPKEKEEVEENDTASLDEPEQTGRFSSQSS